jgi:hypothetical protein
MPTTPVINISSFLDVGLSKCLRAISDASSYSVLSVQMAKLTAKKKKLPDVPPQMWISVQGYTPETLIRKKYKILSQNYAALAALAATEEFLLASLLFLTIYDHALTNNKQISLGDFRALQNKCIEDARQRHIWWTLRKELFKKGIITNYGNSFSSLINLRNILAHRNGVVGDFDVQNRNHLKAEWKRPNLHLDGKKMKLPFVAKEGSKVTIRERRISRKIKKGTQIALSLADFHDICWTLFMFVQEIRTKVGTLKLN